MLPALRSCSAFALMVLLAAGGSLGGCDRDGSAGTSAGGLSSAAQTAASTATPVGSSAATASWSEYRSERGRYTVRLPGTPTERTLTWTSDQGNADVFMVELTADGVAFGASHTEYPAVVRTETPADQQQVLDAARDSMVHHVQGKLVDDTPTPPGERPGRRLTIRQADGQSTIHGRMLLSGSVLYQLTVTTPGPELPAAGKRFLDSFRLQSQAAP